MSKGHNSSYEGFRRKNSLNSHQSANNNTSVEIYHPKIKNEDLRLVENLSMQLQNISKRSLTSKSLGQNGFQQTKSCNSIRIHNEQGIQTKGFNKQKKEANSLKKIPFDHDDDQMELFQVKKQKGSNTLAFNQFDIIQQTRSFCQQEMIDDISPVTMKHSLHEPLDNKNKQQGKPTLKVSATPRTIYKKPAVTKNQLINPKKDKVKHDLTELDKMQKQLQTKKVNRDHFGPKILFSSTGTQRQKQAANAHAVKDNAKMRLLANKDIKIEAKTITKSGKNVLPPKITQAKHLALVVQKSEEKVNQQQMVATRMLTEKEKSNLVNRLLLLRQIIDENEICSDSNEQILSHLNQIQKLLTH